MKKIIRLTESDLTRIVKRIVKEQTEGDTEFVKTIVDKYNISDELKNEIVNTIKSADTKKIKFQPIKMGAGLCLGDRLVMDPVTLRYSLGKFLFILFHELAHQYQFKKYGQEKMLELYNDEIDIKDAAKFMADVEMVADEFAFRKMKNLERRGMVKVKPNDIIKGYENVSSDMLEHMIRSFRNELRKNNVTGAQKISEFLYNMVKIEQNQPKTFTQQQTRKEEPKTYGKTINVSDVEYVVPDGIETLIGSFDTYDIEDLNDVKHIDGNVSIHNNLKTLQNVETINGKLWITNKNFESFGNLKSVNGDVILDKNIILLKNYTEDDINNMIDIGGELIIK
jgi:hypothetical protein